MNFTNHPRFFVAEIIGQRILYGSTFIRFVVSSLYSVPNMSLQYQTLKYKLFNATWINVVLFWTSCVILVWKYTTSISLDWHSKPLAFGLPSRASVLYFALYIICRRFALFRSIFIAHVSEVYTKKGLSYTAGL